MRWRIVIYVAVQLGLAGVVYALAAQGHGGRLAWLVLLPPVAHKLHRDPGRDFWHITSRQRFDKTWPGPSAERFRRIDDCMKTKTKRAVWVSLGTVVLLASVFAWKTWRSHGPALKEVAKDLRAGALSRHAPRPFDRYLEIRYGAMSDPANRQKAFLSFFDPVHLEGMHRLVGYMKDAERQTNIAASAEWIANYRKTMTPAEKDALAGWLQSDQGRRALQQASAVHRSRDIAYRSATEPVIKELMTTLVALRPEGGAP